MLPLGGTLYSFKAALIKEKKHACNKGHPGRISIV